MYKNLNDAIKMVKSPVALRTRSLSCATQLQKFFLPFSEFFFKSDFIQIIQN
jgi:hypothetical protein